MNSSIGKCDNCQVHSNLNYVVTPQKEANPAHSRLCTQCTAKHVDEFLSKENEESIKVNC